MKKISTLCPVAVCAAAVMLPPPAHAAVGATCQSKATCVAKLTSGCCCPTGETQPTYTCPTGWTLTFDGTSCTRSGLSTSDSKGYYTSSYGTCSPTQSGTTECWAMYLDSSTSTECMCTSDTITPEL